LESGCSGVAWRTLAAVGGARRWGMASDDHISAASLGTLERVPERSEWYMHLGVQAVLTCSPSTVGLLGMAGEAVGWEGVVPGIDNTKYVLIQNTI